MLNDHAARMTREAKLVYRCDLPPGAEHGTFFAPAAFEIARLDQLEREVFGPILHVIRWRGGQLDAVLDQVGGDRLRPDARHPQPDRRDGRASSSAALGSAMSTSTAT